MTYVDPNVHDMPEKVWERKVEVAMWLQATKGWIFGEMVWSAVSQVDLRDREKKVGVGRLRRLMTSFETG